MDQISKITTKDTSQCVATASQRRQFHLGASWYIARTSQIARFCLRTCETSQRRLNRSVLLTYQLRRPDMPQHGPGRSNGSLKWVIWVLSSGFFRHLRWFSLFKIPASTSLQRLKDAILIQVPALTSLRHVKLISLTQVSIGTSLRRLNRCTNETSQRRFKQVRLIHVPVAMS